MRSIQDIKYKQDGIDAARRYPVIILNSPLIIKIETLANRLLAQDRDCMEALESLSGKVIALELANTGLKFYLYPSAGGLKIQDHHDGDVNVRIMATLPDMLAYLLSSRDETGATTGSLEVVGDVGLAQRFQSIIRNMDLDWEEAVSRYTGDIFARKFSNLIRGTGGFVKQTGDTLRRDMSEYLLYESEVVPVQEDIDVYVSSVDELRNDVERLKLRIDRLERNITSGS